MLNLPWNHGFSFAKFNKLVIKNKTSSVKGKIGLLKNHHPKLPYYEEMKFEDAIFRQLAPEGHQNKGCVKLWPCHLH
jgi:hypothetical protein